MYLGPKECGGVQARCRRCGRDVPKGLNKILVMNEASVNLFQLLLSGLDFESNVLHQKL